MIAYELNERLAALPSPSPIDTSGDEGAIEALLRYLISDEAKKSLAGDCYWPKWNSPWWHMALLYEMGLAKRIPPIAIEHMVASLKRLLPVFFREDVPAGREMDAPCHCSLGNIFQILCASGVDMDCELPWARSWFLRYQMPDGGLNCDEDAYRAEPQASSMVGTIAHLEAILLFTNRPFTTEEGDFLDRGARCLMERELRFGCKAKHNIEEQEDEPDWLKLCFPRFYFYDMLRGLSFILNWSKKRQKAISAQAVTCVVQSLIDKFPDGNIRVERRAYDGVGTRILSDTGEWARRPSATHFPLLLRVGEVGQVSPYLTATWNECRQLMTRLIAEGLIT